MQHTLPTLSSLRALKAEVTPFIGRRVSTDWAIVRVTNVTVDEMMRTIRVYGVSRSGKRYTFVPSLTKAGNLNLTAI